MKIRTVLIIILYLSFSNCIFSKAEDSVRVAIVQINIVEGDLITNMKNAESAIRKAALNNIDIVCLPEAADLGWLYQNARSKALPIPNKYTDHLSLLAKELNIWVSAGSLEKENNKVYNSAVLIDRGGNIVLKHRKINTLPFLTSGLYDSGSKDSIRVIDTEFGIIGMTICADNFDIKNTMKVAELGAWLLIAPHGFASPVENLYDNANMYVNHIKNMAFRSKLWVIGPNACISKIGGGEWKGYLHSGCSTIADPSGKAVIIGKFNEPDIILFEISKPIQ